MNATPTDGAATRENLRPPRPYGALRMLRGSLRLRIAIPVLLVLLTMCYWLVRVRLRRRPPGTSHPPGAPVPGIG